MLGQMGLWGGLLGHLSIEVGLVGGPSGAVWRGLLMFILAYGYEGIEDT